MNTALKIKLAWMLAVGLHLQSAIAQNVGIGTAAPLSKLSVNGSLSVGNAYVTQTAPANGAIVEGQVGIGTATPSTQLHTTGGVRFQSLSGVGDRLVQTDANGNLSPLTPGTAGQLLTQGAGTLTWTNPQNWLLTGNAGTNAATNFIGTTDNVDWVMRTNNLERARIRATNGRFGVNTTTPMSKLALVDRFNGDFTTLNCCSDLAGFSIFDNTDFVGMTTIDRDGNLGTVDDADGMIYWGDNPNNQDLFFSNLSWNGTSLTRGDRVVIKGDGRVGIGTNAPTQLLTVFNGTTTGTYTTTGWIHSSDRRLKTNIESITGAMDVVNRLEGVWYAWKDHPEAGRQVGFIAQDVQPVLPEVVVGIEGDLSKGETLGMAYQNIVPLLVEALKEKDKEIAALARRNDALQARLEKIEAQLGLQEH